MKSLIATMLFILPAFAYFEKNCEKNDVVSIDVYVSKDRFEPRVIFLKEKDKVCLKVHAVDYNVAFSIEKHPVVVSVPSGKDSLTFFRVGKVGTYKVDCKGGCGLGVNPKIVVQSNEDYEKWQEEKYREKSEKYRKRIDQDFEQESYKKDKDFSQDKKEKNPYRNERYKSKYLEN